MYIFDGMFHDKVKEHMKSGGYLERKDLSIGLLLPIVLIF